MISLFCTRNPGPLPETERPGDVTAPMGPCISVDLSGGQRRRALRKFSHKFLRE
nr:MAG TPA: hypothetical protein [Caudoviricetes sp.]